MMLALALALAATSALGGTWSSGPVDHTFTAGNGRFYDVDLAPGPGAVTLEVVHGVLTFPAVTLAIRVNGFQAGTWVSDVAHGDGATTTLVELPDYVLNQGTNEVVIEAVSGGEAIVESFDLHFAGLEVGGICGSGPITLTADGLSPGARVALLTAFRDGPTRAEIPGGLCAGMELELNLISLKVREIERADAGGDYVGVFDVPAQACDGFVQAVDLDSCIPSGSVSLR